MDVHVILGSESSFKRSLFEDFFPNAKKSYVVADIDEKQYKMKDAVEMAIKVSHAKADFILSNNICSSFLDEKEVSVLVTADIIVWSGSEIFEKPVDEEEARKFLETYGKLPHPKTVCGVVAVNMKTKERFEGVDVVEIQFNKIKDEDIDFLIKEGDLLKCCGAIRIENSKMKQYITKIDGEESSVFGLPETLTKDLVSKALGDK